MRRPPDFVALVAAVVAVGLVLVLAGSWQVGRIERGEQLRDCHRAVAARDDARSVWLYLIDTSTEDRQRAKEFAVHLNELLPPLTCRDAKPVPVYPSSGS